MNISRDGSPAYLVGLLEDCPPLDIADDIEYPAPKKSDEPIVGRITRIQHEHGVAYVDVGQKSEGCVKLSELPADAKTGDECEVMVRSRESHGGAMLLSCEAARRHNAKDTIEALRANRSFVEGVILKEEKGGEGYKVEILGGVHAFLPRAYADSAEIARKKECKFVIVRIENNTSRDRSNKDANNKESGQKGRIVLAQRPVMTETEDVSISRSVLYNATVANVGADFVNFNFQNDVGRQLRGFMSLSRNINRVGMLQANAQQYFAEGTEHKIRVLQIDDFGRLLVATNYEFWDQELERWSVGDVVRVAMLQDARGKEISYRPDGSVDLLICKPDDTIPNISSPDERFLVGTVGIGGMCGIKPAVLVRYLKDKKTMVAAVESVDNSAMGINLTFKDTESDPWKNLSLKVGDQLSVPICYVMQDVNPKFMPKLFASVSPCVDGVLKLNHYQYWVKAEVGTIVDATVSECDVETGRLLLMYGKRDFAAQDKLLAGIAQGAQVSVEVQTILSGNENPHLNGLYVTCDGCIDGFIKERAVARDKSLRDYSVGQKLQAVVESIGLDSKQPHPEHRFLMLSIAGSDRKATRATLRTFGAVLGNSASDRRN